jgi:hypothetical protein
MDQKVIHHAEYWAGKKLSYPNVQVLVRIVVSRSGRCQS